MHADLTRLRYFVKIVEHRSLRRAAEELHVAQPALSRHVQQLEGEFGVPLLIRVARGVVPTDAGMALFNGATRLLTQASRLHQEVGALADSPSGTLRIGVLPAFGHRFLPAIVAGLRNEHAGLNFVLVEGFSHNLRDMVLADELDLAVYAHLGANPELRAAPLYDEQLWLIGRRDSWRAPGGALSATYMRGRPLIVSKLLRPMVEKALAPEAPIVAVEIEGATMTSELIRADVGLYFGPPTMVWKDLQSGEFVGVPVKGQSFRRELVQRKDRPHNAATLLFQKHSRLAVEGFAKRRHSPVSLVGAVKA